MKVRIRIPFSFQLKGCLVSSDLKLIKIVNSGYTLKTLGYDHATPNHIINTIGGMFEISEEYSCSNEVHLKFPHYVILITSPYLLEKE